jgi:hypothetical protein
MSQHQKEQFVLKMLELNPAEFHHGDCIGADAEAHDIVREFFPNVRIIAHPPIIKSKRAFKKADESKEPKEYLIRNHEIVDAVEYMFGAPKTDMEELRSGTWATIRYSRKMNKPITILER